MVGHDGLQRNIILWVKFVTLVASFNENVVIMLHQLINH